MNKKQIGKIFMTVSIVLCFASCKRKETVENRIENNEKEEIAELKNYPGLENITSEYYGTYISEKYLEVLKETKNVINANKYLYETGAMNFIYLNLENENPAFGIINFHEGAEVYSLNQLLENGNKILIDEKNNRYVKVSEVANLDESSNFVENYILKEVFSDYKNIKIEGNTVILNEKKYQVNLDSSFCKAEKANVILRDENWNHYFVVLQDNKINVYGALQDDLMVIEDLNNLVFSMDD